MAWKTGANAPLGLPNAIQPITPDITPLVPIGTVAWFVEDTLGPAQLIYLPGSGVTLNPGDVVVYDLVPGAVAVLRPSSPGPANMGRPLAVCLAIIPTGSYGWFQITGVAIVNALAGTVAGPIMLTATPGAVSNVVIAGSQVLPGRVVSAVGTPAVGKAYMTIDHSYVQGQIV